MNPELCKAWVLPLFNKLYVAVGEYEIIYIINRWSQFYNVPGAPPYCNKLIIWREETVPVFDLSGFIFGMEAMQKSEQDFRSNVIVIVAYESRQKEITYGSFSVNALPVNITVSNDLQCEFPQQLDIWESIALSCFKSTDYGQIPILDIGRIFSSPPKDISSGEKF